MPESLDEIRARRPMPLAKAMTDDTLVALAMNGKILPADHGFPARLVVSGFGAALAVVHLLFTAGHNAPSGPRWSGPTSCSRQCTWPGCCAS